VGGKIKNMKLKEYNPANSKPVATPRAHPASLRLDTKTGRFLFNKTASELMGLKDKCKIVILQDENEPEDWYLEVVKDRGFVISSRDRQSESVFNNTVIARKIAESVGYNGRNGRMLIAGQPTIIGDRTLWGILTINLKNV
jgi:hypothetical protein